MKNETQHSSEKVLKTEDKIIAALFILSIGLLCGGYLTKLIPQHTLNQVIKGMQIGFPMYLFLMYFKRLLITRIGALWITFGVSFFMLSYYFTLTGDFKAVNGHYSHGSLAILTAVLLVYLGQFLNRKIFKRNFQAAAWYSPNTERKIDWFDNLYSIIGGAAIVVSFTVEV